MSQHTLTSGGVTQTLEEWGVESCVVTLTQQGQGDRMEITLTRGVDEPHLFTPLASVTLRSAEGQRRFTGWLLDTPRAASGVSETHTYVFEGPWWQLSGIVFRQACYVASDPTSYTSGLEVDYISKVTLNLDYLTLTKIGVRDQIAAAIDYAIGQGAEIAATTTFIPDVEPPEDQQVDRLCSDVVAGQLRWCPSVLARFDYSDATPRLEFQSNFGTAQLTITDAIAFSAAPLHRLLVKTVRLTYLSEQVAVNEDNENEQRTWWIIPRDESTVVNGSKRIIENTIELRGGDEPEAVPPNGLAAAMHEAFASLYHEMQWTVAGEEVDWTAEIGQRWDIVGAGALFESAQGICQEIVRDIMAGTTTIRCGAPTHLGLADLLALVRPNRLRNISKDAQTFSTGEAPDDTPGTEDLELSFCENGVVVTRVVLAKPATP